MNPDSLSSTGPCTTTHNACQCVIERMRKLEAVADAARLSVITTKDGINVGQYRHLANGDTAIVGENWHKLNDALQALDGDAHG